MGDWRRVKFAVCPKCGRNCSVAGVEDMESEDWQPIGNAEKLSDSEFKVQCPGCAVYFKADVNKSIPCYEEIREEVNFD